MRTPTTENISLYALRNILVSMLKADEAPCSAEMHLAMAVVALQQQADCSTLDDELTEQLKHCMSMVTGKHYD